MESWRQQLVDGVVLWAITGVLGLVVGWLLTGLVSRRRQRRALAVAAERVERTCRKAPQGGSGTALGRALTGAEVQGLMGATVTTGDGQQLVITGWEESAPQQVVDGEGWPIATHSTVTYNGMVLGDATDIHVMRDDTARELADEIVRLQGELDRATTARAAAEQNLKECADEMQKATAAIPLEEVCALPSLSARVRLLMGVVQSTRAGLRTVQGERAALDREVKRLQSSTTYAIANQLDAEKLLRQAKEEVSALRGKLDTANRETAKVREQSRGGYANAMTQVNLDADVKKALTFKADGKHPDTQFQPGGILVQDLIPAIRRLAAERDALKNGEDLKALRNEINSWRDAVDLKNTAIRVMREEQAAMRLLVPDNDNDRLWRAKDGTWWRLGSGASPEAATCLHQTQMPDAVFHALLANDQGRFGQARPLIVALMHECQAHDKDYHHKTDAAVMNAAMAFLGGTDPKARFAGTTEGMQVLASSGDQPRQPLDTFEDLRGELSRRAYREWAVQYDPRSRLPVELRIVTAAGAEATLRAKSYGEAFTLLPTETEKPQS
jgi:hypothetical protein